MAALVTLSAATSLAVACSGDNHGAGPVVASDGGNLDATFSADVVYERQPYDGTITASVQRVPVYAEIVSSRVNAQALLAGGEMQISGEPFAQNSAGRNLSDYDRNYVPPDQYILNNGGDDPIPMTDLFGFSTAVESYEYSKYYMNMVIQESTAGVSLANGPLVAKEAGSTSVARLQARMADLLSNAGTDLAGLAVLPAPKNNALNVLGFPGQWPSFLPYRSWDPTENPTLAVVQSCTFTGGYVGVGFGTTISPAYECDYNTTHLADRNAQVEEGLPRPCGHRPGSVRGRRRSGRSTSQGASTTRATTR